MPTEPKKASPMRLKEKNTHYSSTIAAKGHRGRLTLSGSVSEPQQIPERPSWKEEQTRVVLLDLVGRETTMFFHVSTVVTHCFVGWTVQLKTWAHSPLMPAMVEECRNRQN